MDDSVRGLERADLAALGLVEGGDPAGEEAAGGLRQLGDAPHVLERRGAGDGAAEAEAVEGLVHAAREIGREGARPSHPLPEGLEGEAGEARGQDLEVEVEAHAAVGQAVEEGRGLQGRPAQVEEGGGGLGRQRDEADVERAVAGALDQGRSREDVGGRLLQVVDHLLAPRVETEDAVSRALLDRGRLREPEHGPPLHGHPRGVEVDHDVSRGDDDLAAPPRVGEEEPELRVEDDRRQEGARGEGQGGEELPLRCVAREPPALAAGVDEQDALAGEEAGRISVAPRPHQPVEGPQGRAAGADATARRVGHHLERQLAGVEAVLAPPGEERAEGLRLPLGRGRDEDGVEEAHIRVLPRSPADGRPLRPLHLDGVGAELVARPRDA